LGARGTATTGIYALSLHDALPICLPSIPSEWKARNSFCTSLFKWAETDLIGIDVESTTTLFLKWIKLNEFRLMLKQCFGIQTDGDRKSTRLNSSHVKISYAVFCLK